MLRRVLILARAKLTLWENLFSKPAHHFVESCPLSGIFFSKSERQILNANIPASVWPGLRVREKFSSLAGNCSLIAELSGTEGQRVSQPGNCINRDAIADEPKSRIEPFRLGRAPRNVLRLVTRLIICLSHPEGAFACLRGDPPMKLVSIPVMEIDGQPTQRQLFNPEEHASFQVYSHRNPSVVILRFLNRSLSVEAAVLQDAIRDVIAESDS
jgi:hypothetical protein